MNEDLLRKKGNPLPTQPPHPRTNHHMCFTLVYMGGNRHLKGIFEPLLKRVLLLEVRVPFFLLSYSSSFWFSPPADNLFWLICFNLFLVLVISFQNSSSSLCCCFLFFVLLVSWILSLVLCVFLCFFVAVILLILFSILSLIFSSSLLMLKILIHLGFQIVL